MNREFRAKREDNWDELNENLWAICYLQEFFSMRAAMVAPPTFPNIDPTMINTAQRDLN